MLRKYMDLAFLFFLLVAISGIFMRLYPWFTQSPISYDNVLHAHSHLALIGWAFLAVFLIFLAVLWKQIANKKQAIAICFTLVIVSLLMFLAFLYQGYGGLSIALSTLHIFVEYWAAIFIYKQVKMLRPYHNLSALFIKGALIALVISSLGPYALAIISANGWKEYAIFDMAVYFYLHFQYNGWLTLFLIGLFIMILRFKKIYLHEKMFRLGFWIYFSALFLNYLLSVMWVEQFGVFVHMVGIIGSVGQWLGVLTIVFALKKSYINWKLHFSKLTRFSLWITLFLLLVKSTMELGLIFPNLAELIYKTRSVIIGYLHVTLLGFISIFILTLFFIQGFLPVNKKSNLSFLVFLIGFTLQEILLFGQGLYRWLGFATIPFYTEGLLIAAIILTVGILGLWLSMKKNNDLCRNLSSSRKG